MTRLLKPGDRVRDINKPDEVFELQADMTCHWVEGPFAGRTGGMIPEDFLIQDSKYPCSWELVPEGPQESALEYLTRLNEIEL